MQWCPTAGCPCCRMSIWAKEHVSPTPTTSTVKFLKKSIISRDFLLRQKIRIMGVTTGLSSSSRIKTCKEISGCWGRREWLSKQNKEVLLSDVTGNSNNMTAYGLPLMWIVSVILSLNANNFDNFQAHLFLVHTYCFVLEELGELVTGLISVCISLPVVGHIVDMSQDNPQQLLRTKHHVFIRNKWSGDREDDHFWIQIWDCQSWVQKQPPKMVLIIH